MSSSSSSSSSASSSTSSSSSSTTSSSSSSSSTNVDNAKTIIVTPMTGHLCKPFVEPYLPYTSGMFTRKDFRCSMYESRQNRQWDQFYKNNLDHFFKDRHWLVREFEVLNQQQQAEITLLLDVGCGVGNASIPLIQENKHLRITAFDFSSKAISVFKENEEFDANRIDAFVHDIATEDLPQRVLVDGGRFHFALLIFVLSAMAPSEHTAVFRRLSDALAVGGRILMRDYAEDDLAQHRFEDKDESNMMKLGDREFLRGDGTRVYFFSLADIERIVIESGNRLRIVSSEIVERVVVNRKTQVQMNRKWLQCVFEKQK